MKLPCATLVGLCCGVLLFSLSPAAAQDRPASPAALETVLIVPFENASRQPNLEWLGEGLAELFEERIASSGRVVFTRGEWLAALERLGLPHSTRFSHATLLKVAQEIDADYVLFGTYGAHKEKLDLSGRVLRAAPPALSAPLDESGALEDLLSLHARLSARCLAWMSGSSVPPPSVIAPPPRLRLDAFEHYIRGLLATGPQRIGHLRDAARLQPDWVEPAFALGQTHYAARNCDAALTWLSRVPPAHRRGLEAGFYSGVCHLVRNNAALAESAFSTAALRQHNPAADTADVPELLNNLAVAESRLGHWPEAAAHWQRAQELDAAESSYWFNAALAALRAADHPVAVKAFRESLRLKPEDGEARALLVATLERSGHRAEAAAERVGCQARDCGATPAVVSLLRASTGSLFPHESLNRLDRISMEIELSGWSLAGRAHEGNSNGRDSAGRRAEHLAIHLKRGNEALAAGNLEEARREFSEALLVAPDSAEARVALGEVHRRSGRLEEAVRELRAALWSGESAAIRFVLAQIYLDLGKSAEARAELRAALRVQPDHAEARRLLDSLEAHRPPGGVQ